MHARSVLAFFGAAVALALPACSPGSRAALYDPRALPSGAPGQAIIYGHELLTRTDVLMRRYVRADLECADCHVAAGTKLRGGSFVGTYARFPQWNARAHRVIALQDRIAECFLYSMNGKAPAYSSKQMIAIVAYIAWLSRGTPTGAAVPASDRYLAPPPKESPSVVRGAIIYAGRCSACHGASGRGHSGLFPPLWGATSFNDGAGMSRIARMAGFVKYNMPYDDPGSLSFAQAYDVAAFVLHHPRPHFRRGALETTPALPAKYF
jgi:thiosulfate dehydrogenase